MARTLKGSVVRELSETDFSEQNAVVAVGAGRPKSRETD